MHTLALSSVDCRPVLRRGSSERRNLGASTNVSAAARLCLPGKTLTAPRIRKAHPAWTMRFRRSTTIVAQSLADLSTVLVLRMDNRAMFLR
jgi:hypothetical protein